MDFSVCCGSLPTRGTSYDSMLGNYCLFGEVCVSYPMKITWFCSSWLAALWLFASGKYLMWFQTADVTRGASLYRLKCLHIQTFCCQFFHIIIVNSSSSSSSSIQSLKYFARRCEKSESFLAHSMVAGLMVASMQLFPSEALGRGAIEGGLFSGKCSLMKGLLPSLLSRGHGRPVNQQSDFI